MKHWKTLFAVVSIIFIDLAVYVFLSLGLMAYDDKYDISKGVYNSWQSYTAFDKAILLSFGFWNVLNILFLGYVVYRILKLYGLRFTGRNFKGL